MTDYFSGPAGRVSIVFLSLAPTPPRIAPFSASLCTAMVNIHGRRCQQQGCDKQPTFGRKGQKVRERRIEDTNIHIEEDRAHDPREERRREKKEGRAAEFCRRGRRLETKACIE